MTPQPPRSEAELLDRAEAIAGSTLGELATALWIAIPDDPRRAKGWAGALLERALGATASSRAEPDFPGLGIELKSVPVDARGEPAESTYVCTAPLDPVALGTWASSWVRQKLRRVVWIPVTTEGPLSARIVGAPVAWSPSEADDETLCADWTDIAEIVASGELWRLDARRGAVLQVRPKGQDSDDTTRVLDEDLGWVRETPRGFYLRRTFTRGVLVGRVPPRAVRG